MSRIATGVVLLGLSFGYAAGVVGPAADPVAQHFVVSLSAVGLLTSVFFIALAVLAFAGAAVEDRIGIGWSARLAALLLALGGLAVAASPWFAGVLAGRALAGIGTGLALIACPVIARALRSVVLLGLYGGAITLGLAVSLFVGGQLADAGVSWRVNFIVSAAVPLVALWFVSCPAPHVEPMRRVGLGGIGEVLRSWRFWRLDLLFIFVNGIPVVVGAWLIRFLTAHHGVGAGVAGTLGFLLFGVLTGARPGGGRFAEAPERRLVLAAGGPILAAVGLAVLALSTSPGIAAVAIVAIALGFGAPYAVAYERVEDVIPGNPELGLALSLQGVNAVGIGVVPAVGAALEHGYGRGAFLLLAAFCFVAGAANFTRSAD